MTKINYRSPTYLAGVTERAKQIEGINFDHVQAVIDRIEDMADNEAFYMGDWICGVNEVGRSATEDEHPCGTAACLAGWSVIAGGAVVNGTHISWPDGQTIWFSEDSNRLFGLDEQTHSELFFGHPAERYPYPRSVYTEGDFMSMTEDDAIELLQAVLAGKEQ